jgi:hypothetical protein
MANTKTPLKLYKGTTEPTAKVAGMIWFNTALNLIQVYNGTSWDKFGKVQDVTFEGNKLTITKSDALNSPIVLDFTDVASAQETGKTFGKLMDKLSTIEGNVSTNAGNIVTLGNEIDGVADMVDNLDKKVGFTATDNVKTVIEYVDAKVAAENSASTGAIEAVAEDLADEIERATGVEEGLQTQITANKDAIDVLNGDAKTEGSVKKQVADAVAGVVDGAPQALDTLKEIAAWIQDGDVEGGAVELIERVTTAEGEIDALQTAVNTTLPAAINKAVTDLDSVVAVTAAAEGMVNVLTGVTQADGKLTDKAEVALYSNEKVDALIKVEADRAKLAEQGLTNAIAKEVEDRDDAIEAAIASLDSSYAATTAAEGKVAVMTGLTMTDGVFSGSQTEVYTTAKVDAIVEAAASELDGRLDKVEAAVGTGGSVDQKITDALDALDFAGAAVTPASNGVSVIANVTEENGKISATAIEVEKAGAAAAAQSAAEAKAAELANAAQSAAQSYADGKFQEKGNYEAAGAAAAVKQELLGNEGTDTAESKTIEGVRKYVDAQVAAKNVEAQGDAYVSATAAGNKVTVSTNISALRDEIFVWEEFA